MGQPTPTAEDLAVLDPDREFGDRLVSDRAEMSRLAFAGDLGAVGRIVHRLAGAAGTFGYARIGDIAIEIDDRIAAGGAPVTQAELGRLLETIDRAVGNPKRSG
jgi:HPt (histidine-containing phosphotransfer) domain-containing protein